MRLAAATQPLRTAAAAPADEVIAKADLVDAKGNVKEGTHFLFTATKTGGLVAEGELRCGRLLHSAAQLAGVALHPAGPQALPGSRNLTETPLPPARVPQPSRPARWATGGSTGWWRCAAPWWPPPCLTCSWAPSRSTRAASRRWGRACCGRPTASGAARRRQAVGRPRCGAHVRAGRAYPPCQAAAPTRVLTPRPPRPAALRLQLHTQVPAVGAGRGLLHHE